MVSVNAKLSLWISLLRPAAESKSLQSVCSVRKPMPAERMRELLDLIAGAHDVRSLRRHLGIEGEGARREDCAESARDGGEVGCV